MDQPSGLMDSALGFEVKVHTSSGPKCGTFNSLWLKLIGSDGETPPVYVNEHLVPGSTCQVLVRSSSTLGRLLIIRLCLEIRPSFPNQAWHCAWVEVRRLTGEGKTEAPSEVQTFLCDRWLRPEDGTIELRSDKLCLLMDETEEMLRQERFKYLQNQQELIRWQKFVDGAPHCVTLSLPELGPNLTYTHTSSANNLHYFKGFESQMEPWRSFADLDAVFAQSAHKNSVAKFVQAHWKDDWYFGYQCLNGSNPLLLRQTRLLPPNLSVTSEMLHPFLPEGSSLEQELLKGAVYLLDYEILDGIPTNVVNGKQTYISAPLCLLHLNQQGQLLPIAIQLQQKPGPQNPVFLPSDGDYVWLLAKIWVRSADFQCHQLASHFLRTHMMAELFCGATLRHLPHLHPLHQLLMPHVRTSLQINLQARASMLAAGGVFDKAIGSGLETLPVLLSRATERLSYRSLCVPDDLKDRGVDKLPQSYYAQDAQRVWEALRLWWVGSSCTMAEMMTYCRTVSSKTGSPTSILMDSHRAQVSLRLSTPEQKWRSLSP
ncbi:polyunsaturated fatty acid lipoxygenase ALOX15B isoform X2 [Nelusetta ayraudi]|uniref:polyunsaturated fatty acid lipoxygenase ALOX15B isoform X2 n=1 Tax=Nelusetta ayraudi TaxID=303726 RepID=UPI003F702C2C